MTECIAFRFLFFRQILKTNLYNSDKGCHHHGKSFSSIKCWSTPLKGIWNAYPTARIQHLHKEMSSDYNITMVLFPGSLPWSSADKPWTIDAAMHLCLWPGILVGTTDGENVCVEPHNWNGEQNSKPAKDTLSRMQHMRQILSRKQTWLVGYLIQNYLEL